MENTYSKNSSVIPRNSLFIGHASNPPYSYYNTTKSIKGLGAIRAKIGPTSDVDKKNSKMYSQYVLFINKYS
jgi:hypothetical protein